MQYAGYSIRRTSVPGNRIVEVSLVSAHDRYGKHFVGKVDDIKPCLFKSDSGQSLSVHLSVIVAHRQSIVVGAETQKQKKRYRPYKNAKERGNLAERRKGLALVGWYSVVDAIWRQTVIVEVPEPQKMVQSRAEACENEHSTRELHDGERRHHSEINIIRKERPASQQKGQSINKTQRNVDSHGSIYISRDVPLGENSMGLELLANVIQGCCNQQNEETEA